MTTETVEQILFALAGLFVVFQLLGIAIVVYALKSKRFNVTRWNINLTPTLLAIVLFVAAVIV